VGFRLIDRGWRDEFDRAAKLRVKDLLIVSPFLQHGSVKRLLRDASRVRVLTRFNVNHFYEGVSSLDALDALLERRAKVKGVRHLHAKMYVFGRQRAFVTSANLTDAAVMRNHELGFVTDEPDVIRQCRDYFEGLWGRAGRALTSKTLSSWRQEVDAARAKPDMPARTRLRDHGADLGFTPHVSTPEADPGSLTRAFVKFFGEGDKRSDLTSSVLEEVDRSGSHWACSYPKGRRPRSVQDGDVMFIGRMVRDPDDTRIIGRAIGFAHVKGLDDASPADISRRPWKRKWPHYVQVREPEFVHGMLANGVSLNRLMVELGWAAFASTTRNHERGRGNVNPRLAFRQQAAVELSSAGTAWLNRELDDAFWRHGKLPQVELDRLDQPPRGRVGGVR
jgi:hypothetical protein